MADDWHFEWDKHKADSNQAKHGISFAEAVTVFYDFLAFVFDDELHSQEESRQIIIGHSERNKLLVVCYTPRGEMIRLISARKATTHERRSYERKQQSGR